MPDADPLAYFHTLYERARTCEPEPSAVALATVDESGQPAVRMVLLKGYDERGFVIYTNYQSRKAHDLAAHPRAALCFFWYTLQAQVRVEGAVAQVSATESDAYFASRPRGSQLAAWSSQQSALLPDREDLLARYREVEARFQGGPVPRPPFWGGYRVAPERIEFWHGQQHRMHDRRLYVRQGAGWQIGRLYP